MGTIRKLKKQQQQQKKNTRKRKNWTEELKPQTGQKLTQFAPRMCGSLILCQIVVYSGLAKEIPHTNKSVKRVCLLSQQSDVEFARPVDN